MWYIGNFLTLLWYIIFDNVNLLNWFAILINLNTFTTRLVLHMHKILATSAV